MIIAVAGNIGAGKSTLVGRLATHYQFTPLFEAVDQNPYLQDFYKDMSRWAFPLQMRFLTLRFQQALGVQTAGSSYVMDRTIYEDAEVFARNLRQNALLSERDYQTYALLYQTIIPMVQPPDVLVYLEGSTPVLAARIDRRNEEKKRQQKTAELVPIKYLDQLNRCYSHWIERFTRCPVITVTIEITDLNDDAHFQTLIETIDSILK